MGWVLPRPIRNKVGYEFLKKTLSGFRSDPGFIKKIRDLTRNLVIYNFIITKISSYIYIYKQLMFLLVTRLTTWVVEI